MELQPTCHDLGIVAGWALIFLGLSFYIRDRNGRARWKVIHRFTLLAWIAGVVHTIVEGTDAGTVWYIALLVATTAPVLVLLAIRIVRLPGARQDRLALIDSVLAQGPRSGSHARPRGLDMRCSRCSCR